MEITHERIWCKCRLLSKGQALARQSFAIATCQNDRTRQVLFRGHWAENAQWWESESGRKSINHASQFSRFSISWTGAKCHEEHDRRGPPFAGFTHSADHRVPTSDQNQRFGHRNGQLVVAHSVRITLFKSWYNKAVFLQLNFN